MTKRFKHTLATALTCASAGLVFAAATSTAAPTRTTTASPRLSRAMQISTCQAIGCFGGQYDCHYYVGTKEYECGMKPVEQ